MIEIEVFFFEGCPHHEPTLQRLREVVEALGIDANLREVAVADAKEAEALRFLGSPSVRVNGRDIEPGADELTEFALSCRIYGVSGVPSRELMRVALVGESSEPAGP